MYIYTYVCVYVYNIIIHTDVCTGRTIRIYVYICRYLLTAVGGYGLLQQHQQRTRHTAHVRVGPSSSFPRVRLHTSLSCRLSLSLSLATRIAYTRTRIHHSYTHTIYCVTENAGPSRSSAAAFRRLLVQRTVTVLQRDTGTRVTRVDDNSSVTCT